MHNSPSHVNVDDDNFAQVPANLQFKTLAVSMGFIFFFLSRHSTLTRLVFYFYLHVFSIHIQQYHVTFTHTRAFYDALCRTHTNARLVLHYFFETARRRDIFILYIDALLTAPNKQNTIPHLSFFQYALETSFETTDIYALQQKKKKKLYSESRGGLGHSFGQVTVLDGAV